jgi:nitrogen fixation protein FixH
VGVLALTVGANVAVFVAARDPHAAAIEPDYYRKAVAWDSTLAEERRSEALGWRLDAQLLDAARDGARLRVRLADRDRRPLEGARVSVEAIHDLEADVRVRGVLAPHEPGVYEARLTLRHAGEWELRFDVRRGADRFATSLRREAVWPSTPR